MTRGALEGLVVGVLTLFAAVPIYTLDIWEGCGCMCLQSSDSLGKVWRLARFFLLNGLDVAR